MGKKNSKKIIFLVLIIIVVFIFVKNLVSSYFFQKKDRINFVIYDKEPIFYSIGIKDKIHYRLKFYPDYVMVVPGGYGNYRIGALGKLINLEKNPDLFKKTFSLSTLSFTDNYFYKESQEIYYGSVNKNNFSNLLKLFTYSTNLNFFNRVYIYWQLISKKEQDYSDLELGSKKKFARLYSGYFFQKMYRDEKKNIQIIYYKNYDTANEISNIIEGNGIRVVDISENKIEKGKCRVIEESNKFSNSSKKLAEFFSCDLKKGQTETSDIIMILGDLEKSWEVK